MTHQLRGTPNQTIRDGEVDLLLLGASTRFLARWFVKAGYRPLAIDLFADRDLQALCPTLRVDRDQWPTGLARECEPYPGVPVVYCGGLENHPPLLETLAKRHPLLGNSPECLRKSRDIDHWGPILREAGFAVPPWRGNSGSGKSERVPDEGDWILKPRQGAGGLGIRKAQARETIPPGFIAQKWVSGHGVSLSFCLGTGDPWFFLGCQELPRIPCLNAPPFVYLGNSVFRGFPLVFGEKGKQLGLVLRDRLGLRGLVGVDGIYHQGQLTVLEINPRPTASMELADPFEGNWLARWHIASFLGSSSSLSRSIPRERSFTKAILYAHKEFPFPEDWPDSALENQLKVTFADLPSPGEPMAKGEPILTIILEESDPGRMIQRVEEAVFLLKARFPE